MRRLYGSGPLHLLGHLAVFALAIYAVAAIFDVLDAAPQVMLWLVGAVLLHDAVLWPAYTAADGAAQRVLGSAINYVRVPLGLSLLLVLAFFATVTGKGGSTYTSVSGETWDGYVTRWLLVSAGMFIVSGVVFLVNRRRSP